MSLNHQRYDDGDFYHRTHKIYKKKFQYNIALQRVLIRILQPKVKFEKKNCLKISHSTETFRVSYDPVSIHIYTYKAHFNGITYIF